MGTAALRSLVLFSLSALNNIRSYLVLPRNGTNCTAGWEVQVPVRWGVREGFAGQQTPGPAKSREAGTAIETQDPIQAKLLNAWPEVDRNANTVIAEFVSVFSPIFKLFFKKRDE